MLLFIYLLFELLRIVEYYYYIDCNINIIIILLSFSDLSTKKLRASGAGKSRENKQDQSVTFSRDVYLISQEVMYRYRQRIASAN